MQYLVADEVVNLVEEMVTTAEAAVREGTMVQTPTPPTKTGRKLGAADRPVAKEVGWRRQNDGLGDGGKSVRSAIGTHRIVRPSIAALTVRSAIGAQRILVRPAMAELTARPAIMVFTGYY